MPISPKMKLSGKWVNSSCSYSQGKEEGTVLGREEGGEKKNLEAQQIGKDLITQIDATESKASTRRNRKIE